MSKNSISVQRASSKETCEEYYASFSFRNTVSYKENDGNLMVAIHKQYWQKCIPSFPLDDQSKTFSSALLTNGIQKTFPHTGKTFSQDSALIKRDS
jgi:hypothetical protein